MHKEILNKDQIQLLPLLKDFNKSFYLVGGTAIALQIGHRRSIDFDLFKFTRLNHKLILGKIENRKLKPLITRKVEEQMNLTLNKVKFTFFHYPFPIQAKIEFEKFIKMPSLLELAAMKAYALGRRSKWKDYVDLYYILSAHHSIKDISLRAEELYGQLFSEKQFRAQLCFFDDIDRKERVEYLGKAPSEAKIKKTLTQLAIQF